MEGIMNPKTKQIEVVPYNPDWPLMFEEEAALLKQTLGNHCLDIYHIGSTSVPGLSAKRDLDIACVVDKLDSSLILENIGYIFKGEINIPLRNFFSKNTERSKVNLHVVEAGHHFIPLNLCFRNYLRAHDDARDAYQKLKYELLSDPASFERIQGRFSRYALEKHGFIQSILDKADYKNLGAVFCMHYREWDTAKMFRQKYFFDQVPIADPFTWTFNHPEHAHLIFSQGTNIIGYAHLQFWAQNRAAMRIIVLDELSRNKGLGGQFLSLCERWLKTKDYRSLHVESSPEACAFYKKHGYIDMPFNDPDDYEGHPQDIPMGKLLFD
jgi:GrpB-like predicted nucleotidyltransferase (UPF0157 family)